jgi:hypothetical protein
MTDMPAYKIDRASVEMAELANRLRIMANAADGYHARQHGGTYGAAHEATILALACGIAEQSKVHFPEAREAASRMQYECVDNGEDVTYQITKVFAPDSGYHGWGGIDFTIVVVDASTCDCGDPACGCGCIPGNYPCEHGSVGAGCGE